MTAFQQGYPIGICTDGAREAFVQDFAKPG